MSTFNTDYNLPGILKMLISSIVPINNIDSMIHAHKYRQLRTSFFFFAKASSLIKRKILSARWHVRSSLTKSFRPGCLGSFFSRRGHSYELPLGEHIRLILFLFSNERASNPSRSPALPSVPLRATNGLWIASSFCRATSFTEGFHSPLYPRALVLRASSHREN